MRLTPDSMAATVRAVWASGVSSFMKIQTGSSFLMVPGFIRQSVSGLASGASLIAWKFVFASASGWRGGVSVAPALVPAARAREKKNTHVFILENRFTAFT